MTDTIKEQMDKELKRLVYIVAQSPQNSKYKSDARLIALGNIEALITSSNRKARIAGRDEVLDIIPDRRPYKAIKEYTKEQIKRTDRLAQLREES